MRLSKKEEARIVSCVKKLFGADEVQIQSVGVIPHPIRVEVIVNGERHDVIADRTLATIMRWVPGGYSQKGLRNEITG